MLTEQDHVVLHFRPGCHVCARVRAHLETAGVPFELRDVDRDPLTPKELWNLFTRKANRLRVPFTVLNDGEDVVLGFDPQRLDGVFVRGELGGAVPSDLVAGTHVHDAYPGAGPDPTLWRVAVRGRTTDPHAVPAPHVLSVRSGRLTLKSAADVRYLATRRYATPPGSLLEASLSATAEAVPPGAAAEVWLRDEPTGIAVGFRVTPGSVLAVHERALLPGVTLAEEAFTHEVLTDVSPSTAVRHDFRLCYEHDRARARWYVDERLVYEARTPMAVEGWSPAVGVRAGTDPAAATRLASTPWHLTTTLTDPATRPAPHPTPHPTPGG